MSAMGNGVQAARTLTGCEVRPLMCGGGPAYRDVDHIVNRPRPDDRPVERKHGAGCSRVAHRATTGLSP